MRVALDSAAATLVGSAGEILVEGHYESEIPHGDAPDDFNFAGYVAEVEVDIETARCDVLA